MTSKSKGKRTSAIGRRYNRRRAAQRRYARRGRASKGSRPKEKPNTNGKQNNQPQRTYNRNTSIHTGASISTYNKYSQTSKGSIPKENTNTNGKQNNQPQRTYNFNTLPHTGASISTYTKHILSILKPLFKIRKDKRDNIRKDLSLQRKNFYGKIGSRLPTTIKIRREQLYSTPTLSGQELVTAHMIKTNLSDTNVFDHHLDTLPPDPTTFSTTPPTQINPPHNLPTYPYQLLSPIIWLLWLAFRSAQLRILIHKFGAVITQIARQTLQKRQPTRVLHSIDNYDPEEATELYNNTTTNDEAALAAWFRHFQLRSATKPSL